MITWLLAKEHVYTLDEGIVPFFVCMSFEKIRKTIKKKSNFHAFKK